MNKSLTLATVVLVLIAAFLLLRPAGEPPAPIEGLPWQIETLANGGSRVFGLELSRSTLDDARMRFGDDLEIGLVAALDDATLAGLRNRSIRKKQLDATTYRFILDAADLPLAWRAPIATITFIPAASLDAETVIKRFGTPQERVRSSDGLEHFLYPDKGLDLTLDDKGKEVLQYVAPREFARLREPLRQGGAPTPSKP